MDKICDKNRCSGCGACSGICPKGCIELEPDNEDCGQIHPVIDNSRCINCGLCVKTCPANNPIRLNNPQKTYAAYALEDKICDSSSSGGLAFTLASAIIKDGGNVYGSIIRYGDDLQIMHDCSTTIDELKRTQGSKYVQSKISRDIYVGIKRDLEEGKKVLFVGTGCQVAGIRNYLKKDYPNFFAIDIICHGVPSIQILKDFLRGKINLSDIERLSFRGKSGFDMSLKSKTGNLSLPLKNNAYMMGFMKALYYRNSCYSCPYAHQERGGDITLGDFWGLKKSISPADRKSSGTSVVLVNTDKGETLLSSITDKLNISERHLQEAVNGNPQLRKPSKRHYASRVFKILYPALGFATSGRLCLVREKLFYSYILPILQSR